MKFLITGSDGMLGTDFIELLKSTDHEVIPTTIKELDITDKEQVLQKVMETKPDIVINFAAYTNVDNAEINKELCYNINVLGVKNICEACKKEDITILHMSTSYVFDGSKKSYDEDEKVKNPINYYGKTKSEAEDIIQKSLDNFYIIRTSWLFGKNGRNFVKAIINKSAENNIKVIDNQFGTPTYTLDLSKAIIELIGKPYGIYHLTNFGSCSWYEFALEINKNIDLKCKILPCTDHDFNRTAKRPSYSLLKNNKTEQLRDWKLALKDYLNEGLK